MESIFASRAVIGQRYLTKRGWPVTVLAMGLAYGRTAVELRNDLTGTKTIVSTSQLLWPYDEKRITKEAIHMAKAQKETTKTAGFKGSARGAARAADGVSIRLFREIDGAIQDVMYLDGTLTYKGKKYATLKAVAEAIRCKAVSGSGRSFFGLRTQGNIELGKEIIRGLADNKQEGGLKFPKVKRVKARKADDDEEETARKATKESATIVAKGRK